eukprot:GILK01029175.1.p1 GENE.GILK01029175.1~~GILK01029175.1.p1  ORF type:complete len:130 (-),score=5.03 GILK01029175.1:10-357(-)
MAEAQNNPLVYINTANGKNNRWGSPGILTDTTVVGGLSRIMAFSININPNMYRRPTTVMSVSFSLAHVNPLIIANVATSASKNAVYTNYFQYQYNTSVYLLVGGKFDFSEYNTAA